MTGLWRCGRPYDRTALDDAVRRDGCAVLTGLLPAQWCTRAQADVRAWLADHPADGGVVRGPHSLWIRSIVDRLPFAAKLVGQPELVGWARRMLAPEDGRIRLADVEYRERLPGESERDTDAEFHRGVDPENALVIVALGPFTVHNGAPWFATGSHLPADPTVDERNLVRAEAGPGDAVVFSSRVLHRVGANRTAQDVLRTVSIGYRAER